MIAHMRTKIFENVAQPYQVFFPLGLFYGIWGVLTWPLFQVFGGAYPGPLHISLMSSGFLVLFAAGFLMTAIPRFTGGPVARSWEFFSVLALSAWPAGVVLVGAPPYTLSLLASSGTLSVLLYFYISRRLKGSFQVPKHFDLVGLGLSCGLSGTIILLLVQTDILSPDYLRLGTALQRQHMMLFLILGVGSRLVAGLLGWARPPRVEISKSWIKARFKFKSEHFQMTLLCVSVALDIASLGSSAAFLRAGVCSWIALHGWRLYRLPRQKGRLPNWLWISGWGLLAGLWLQALVPSLGAHGAHVVFIAGFSWMILIVASRVTLAHGGYDLALEFNSRAIRVAGVLVLVSALTRLSAPFVAASYMNHLAYAGLAWSLGALVWAWVFVPRMLIHASVWRNRS